MQTKVLESMLTICFIPLGCISVGKAMCFSVFSFLVVFYRS